MHIIRGTALPIWKDIWATPEGTALEGFNKLSFDVIFNTGLPTVIFSGTAVKRPEDTLIRVRLNDLIGGLLRPSMQALPGDKGFYRDGSTYAAAPGAFVEFAVLWKDPSGAVASEYTYYDVFADWSYDRNADYDTDTAYMRYCPIDGIVDVRQRIFLTALTGAWMLLVDAAGTGHGNIDKPTGEGASIPGTFWMKASEIDESARGIPLYPELYGGSVDEARGMTPIVVSETCARYCLYYANALGGIDSFLIRGKTVRTDALTRGEYTRRGASEALDGGVLERGRTVLGTSIRQHLEMHTHWLSDDEAGRMWHLMESPAVWVHDLEEDIIYPAVLTGREHRFKSYRGEGGHLVSYQIDLDIATDTERG